MFLIALLPNVYAPANTDNLNWTCYNATSARSTDAKDYILYNGFSNTSRFYSLINAGSHINRSEESFNISSSDIDNHATYLYSGIQSPQFSTGSRVVIEFNISHNVVSGQTVEVFNVGFANAVPAGATPCNGATGLCHQALQNGDTRIFQGATGGNLLDFTATANVEYNVVLVLNETGVLGTEYINGLFRNTVGTPGTAARNLTFSARQTGVTTTISDLRVYNYTTGCPAVGASPDTTSPTIFGSVNNTNPKFNERLNATFNLTDETTLQTGRIIINQSGYFEYFNFTISGTSASISQNFTVNLKKGSVINITGVAIDSSSNQQQNTSVITISDTLGFIKLGLNLTTIRKNNTINISANITDVDNNAIFGWIAHNISGVFSNFTFSISGINPNISVVLQINLSRGNVVNMTAYYNDTYNVVIQNSTSFTISNTIPITSLVTITPLTAYTTSNLTCNPTNTDVDNDVITNNFLWYINTIKTGNITNTLNSGNFSVNDDVVCEVIANDGFDNGIPVNSSITTIQNPSPIIDWINLPQLNDTLNNSATMRFYFNVTDPDSPSSSITCNLIKNVTLSGIINNTYINPNLDTNATFFYVNIKKCSISI